MKAREREKRRGRTSSSPHSAAFSASILRDPFSREESATLKTNLKKDKKKDEFIQEGGFNT